MLCVVVACVCSCSCGVVLCWFDRRVCYLSWCRGCACLVCLCWCWCCCACLLCVLLSCGVTRARLLLLCVGLVIVCVFDVLVLLLRWCCVRVGVVFGVRARFVCCRVSLILLVCCCFVLVW